MEPTAGALDPADLGRLVVRAHLACLGAREALRAWLQEEHFPWYEALGTLHRQGLRALFQPLGGDLAPVNVRVDLEREAALEEAREVVLADRVRRVEQALAEAGLGTGLRVWPEEHVVLVEAPGDLVPEVPRALGPLGLEGPAPVAGQVNRLAPPAIHVHARGELPAPVRWIQVLHRAAGCGVTLDEEALSRIPDPVEPEEVPTPPPVRPCQLPGTAAEILAVALGGVGDLHLTLPALEAVRRRYPGCRVALQTNPHLGELLRRRVPTVDDLEPFDWELAAPEEEMRDAARQRWVERAHRADLLVVVGPLPALPGLALEVPVLELRASPEAPGHRTRQLLQQVAAAGIDTGGIPVPTSPRVEPGEVEATRRELAAQGLGKRGHPWTLLLIGASSTLKMWPVERFAALGAALPERAGGTPFVLRHAPDERLVEELARRCPPLVVLPDRSLVDLCPVLAACDLVVGNDTGPLHLAAALGVPTVALFGGTDPGYYGPLGSRVVTLGGTRPWRRGVEERLRKIQVEEVLAALERSGLVPGRR